MSTTIEGEIRHTEVITEDDEGDPRTWVDVTLTSEGVIIDAYDAQNAGPVTFAKTYDELFEWLTEAR